MRLGRESPGALTFSRAEGLRAASPALPGGRTSWVAVEEPAVSVGSLCCGDSCGFASASAGEVPCGLREATVKPLRLLRVKEATATGL